MKLRSAFLLLIPAMLFSVDATACGDSMYRVGKGVSYRIYTAPLPGSVLVYGESEGARQLAEALARSGHGVRYVASTPELASELSSGVYDVVIAPYSDHETVETSSAALGEGKTRFLPVVASDEDAKLVENYSNVMVADRDEIKHYLKAIHKTLKAKGQG